MLAVDPDTSKKVIWLAEVKSSQRDPYGKFLNASKLDLLNRGGEWIREAATGTINGKKVSDEARAYAQRLRSLMNQGYKIKPVLVKVTVPKPGQVGTSTIKITPAG